MTNPTTLTDAHPELLPRLLSVWANRQDIPRRRVFADWFAAAVPAVAVEPVPPLPGGDAFLQHWRSMRWPFSNDPPIEAGVVRDLRKLRGYGVKRGGPVRVRPFAYPGRARIGGIECLFGDSGMPSGRALEAAVGLQFVFGPPVTAVFGQRPVTDLPSRFIVWLWPADSGPWFWPGNGVPRSERLARMKKRRCPALV